MQTFLVTVGLSFISYKVIYKLEKMLNYIINLDKVTCACNPQTLAELQDTPGYHFVRGNIGNIELLHNLLKQYQSNATINAAESYIDCSILSSQDFIQTNILRTFQLLEASRAYFQSYLTNSAWVGQVQSSTYQTWIKQNYEDRTTALSR